MKVKKNLTKTKILIMREKQQVKIIDKVRLYSFRFHNIQCRTF